MLQNELGRTFMNVVSLKDELKHGEWEEHKYVAKVPVGNGKYRYFYDMNEYKKHMENLSLGDLKKICLNTDWKKYMPDIDDATIAELKKYITESSEDDKTDIIATITDVVLKDSPQSKTISELNKKDRVYTPDEDWQVINEYYNLDIAGHEAYTTNCASCTAAYDLRRRGYDVVASGISYQDDEPTPEELLSWYDGAVVVDSSNNENLKKAEYGLTLIAADAFLSEAFSTDKSSTKEDSKEVADLIYGELKKQGNGARGHLVIYWYPIGGHSVVYEVVNDKVEIKDCQTFEKYTIEDDLVGLARSIGYIRTDNVEVNDSILDRVENRLGVDRNAKLSRNARQARVNNTVNYRSSRR